MTDFVGTEVRVAAAHAAPVFLDRRASIDKAAGIIAEAGRQGARLVVFPEAFIPGFPYWINFSSILLHQPLYVRLWEQSVDLRAEPEVVRPLQAAARTAGVVVVMGLNERVGGTLYNAQLFLDHEGGILGSRRKLVPTLAERTVWGFGDGSTLRTWDTAVGRVGGLMCFEHTMNLARQALIVQGIQIHAAAWPGLSSLRGVGPLYHERVGVLTRNHALTGQCFVVSAMNPVAPDVFATIEPYLGPTELMGPGPAWSAIIHPSTAVLAEETGAAETLVTTDINLRDIVGAKFLIDSAGHYGRPEVLSMSVNAAEFRSIQSRTARDLLTVWQSDAQPVPDALVSGLLEHPAGREAS